MRESVERRFSTFAQGVSSVSASPYATVFVLFFIACWLISGPLFHFSDTWQLIINTTSSVVTFAMVFVLNHSQLRDTKAMNTKLDELIRSIDQADNRVIALEERPMSDAVALSEAIRDAVAENPAELAEAAEELMKDGKPLLETAGK